MPHMQPMEKELEYAAQRMEERNTDARHGMGLAFIAGVVVSVVVFLALFASH